MRRRELSRRGSGGVELLSGWVRGRNRRQKACFYDMPVKKFTDKLIDNLLISLNRAFLPRDFAPKLVREIQFFFALWKQFFRWLIPV
jgi:hypothetical protein